MHFRSKTISLRIINEMRNAYVHNSGYLHSGDIQSTRRLCAGDIRTTDGCVSMGADAGQRAHVTPRATSDLARCERDRDLRLYRGAADRLRYSDYRGVGNMDLSDPVIMSSD